MNKDPVSDVYDEVDQAFLCTLFSQISFFDFMEVWGLKEASV
jgi:hypothetical protein